MDTLGLHDPLPDDLGDGTPDRPKWIVDVWLALPTVDGWRVLMLLRSERRGGFWQGVSGGVEPGDASLAEAALREIREETGLEPGIGRLMDLRRTYTFTSPFSGRTFVKRSFGVLLPETLERDTIRLSDEHVATRVMTIDQARAIVRWDENREELSALERAVQPSPPNQRK